jgi:hypothetical protein
MGIIWDWLRLSRHGPPGAAAGDEEASGVFRAALEQFEELMRAAAETGPAARPLPLFYALSQAGRAIVAARGGPDHKVHGITLHARADAVFETVIEPVATGKLPGQYQAVSIAVASPVLSGPTPLAALFASLPETGNEILEIAADRPRPLSVWPATEPPVPVPGWTHVLVVFDEDVRTPDQVNESLRSYPTASGRLALSEAYVRLGILPREWSPGGMGVRMLVRGDLDDVAPQYRIVGRRWVRPAISGDSAPPNPLMTWWLLLFALSMLARYDPLAWVRALDVDSSSCAVSLERAMRKAIDALPQLVGEAIYNSPMSVHEGTFTGTEAPFD